MMKLERDDYPRMITPRRADFVHDQTLRFNTPENRVKASLSIDYR